MKKISYLLVLISTVGSLWAQPVKIEVARAFRNLPAADGVIGREEYRSRVVDKQTGIEIFSSADSANIYLALRSPGSGWLALGLGASGMKGALIILGHRNEKGNWTVGQHLGKALFRHSPVEKANLISTIAWQEEGKTCMEFSLPLQYAPGKSVGFDNPTPVILAYHKDRGDLSKHTRKSTGTMVLVK